MKKSLFRRCLNRVLNLVVRFSPGSRSLRPRLHRWRGVKMGHDVFIGDEVYIDNEYPEMIEIQDRAAVSMRAVIIAHSMGPGKVVIEREAFIGPQVVVLCSGGKTLRIGEGAVISAGCMITRSIPPRVVIAPAPTQLVGHASISMPASRTVEEFWSGLKPAKRSAGRGSTAAPRAGAPADSDKSA